MAVKFPAPSPPFIAARHRGGSQKPKAITLHGTVSSDNAGTARQIAQWWHGPTSPMSSAHYVVDPREVIQCVGDHTVAYHCGYNTGSIGVEFCDEQQGPASRWSDADSTAILERAARLVAQLCLAYDIAPVRPSIAELKRKGPHGIYGHNDSRLAFGNTTHSDPRDFPWELFMGMVRKEIAAIKKAAEPKPEPKPAPKPPKAERPTERVHFMEASLQFGDTDEQHTEDIEAIFTRAVKRDVKAIGGTEAGPGARNTSRELIRIGQKYGYRVWCPSGIKGLPADKGGTTDCWIAVKDSFVLGNWEQGFDPVIPGSRAAYIAVGHDPKKVADMHPRWGTKGLVRVAFDSPLGRIHLGAGHYLTDAHHPGATVKGVDHWAWNKKLAGRISEWAVESGKGKALVFYFGDQNMADQRNDTPQGDSFFGGPLTSAADELEDWQNSGHGPIDVIASYDEDARVKAAYWRVLDDKEFALHTDHFLCEAGFDVKLPR